MIAIACPSCRAETTPTRYTSHVGTVVEIDICWPCHLIWFDHLESTSLSANSVIELFRSIHTHQREARSIVAQQSKCPVCNEKLLLTNDVTRSNKFSYQRCPNGHGRLITFVQFLREKNFIRTLSAAEIRTLSVNVKQIRCSSCGAGVNIEHDTSCKHCGAPVSVLDDQAVAKALADFDSKAKKRVDLASGPRTEPTYPRDPPLPQTTAFDTGALVDLVATGIAALITATLD